MKIALVHDSFTQMGGAERVVDALHELFPEAPVFTLVFDSKFKQQYKSWDIRTSSLQSLYSMVGKLQYLLPLIPWGVSTLDFSGYDLVISSSSGWIKNIKVPVSCIHINYCHTPTRFLWSDADYVKQEVNFIQRPIVSLILKWMKKWDFNGAQRVTKFIANSKEVQQRIKLYYNRDSEVIYPFVDVNYWQSLSPNYHREEVGALSGQRGDLPQDKIASGALAMTVDRDNFLLVGRLQAHKKTDLIIEIFNELNLPLHVVGTGRYEDHLRTIAKSNIKFFGHIADKELAQEYSGAKILIFPQTEDFGLVPLEAAAYGTPTLAYAKGGALETIKRGVTGEFFESYNKEEIKQIILNWDSGKYKEQDLQTQAKDFGKEKFKEQIIKFISIINRK
jgi:glycosyltransferase involved in cell wall biosynthesis